MSETRVSIMTEEDFDDLLTSISDSKYKYPMFLQLSHKMYKVEEGGQWYMRYVGEEDDTFKKCEPPSFLQK